MHQIKLVDQSKAKRIKENVEKISIQMKHVQVKKMIKHLFKELKKGTRRKKKNKNY